MKTTEIIALLPYRKPFLFVDEITFVNEQSIEGHFTFSDDLSFYEGHFKNQPVTPGVILIETMAQIGLVSFGIYLNREVKNVQNIAFTAANVDFLKPVFPNEKVVVRAEKVYFRFGKLRCQIKMYNTENELVCKGTMDGMMFEK